MAVSRAAAEALTVITTRAREENEDPAVDGNGNTIPAAQRSFTDAQYLDAANQTLKWMQMEMAITSPGEVIASIDFVYTESVDRKGMDLPAGVGASQLAKLTDVTSGEIYAAPLIYVNVQEIEDKELGLPVTSGYVGQQWWTILTEGTAHRVMIRPSTTGRTYRLWYFASPLVYSSVTDAPALTAQWSQFISLDIAFQLGRRSGRWTVHQQLAYDRHRDQFKTYAARARAPKRVRIVRGLE